MEFLLVLFGFIFSIAAIFYAIENIEKSKYKSPGMEHFKKEEKKEDYTEYNRNLLNEANDRLYKKAKEDTERYLVEVTTKDGVVYKSEVFGPSYSVSYDKTSCGQVVRIREYYSSSKYLAEQFVQNSSRQTLVRFGDDFICPKSVSRVKLVKVK